MLDTVNIIYNIPHKFSPKFHLQENMPLAILQRSNAIEILYKRKVSLTLIDILPTVPNSFNLISFTITLNDCQKLD